MTDLAQRLNLMVEAAGGLRALSRIARVTPATVHGWLNGSAPYASSLEKVLRHSGVSREWLAYGRGEVERELEKVRAAAKANPASGARGALLAALDERGWSIAQLAKQTGYNSAILERIITGPGRLTESLAEVLEQQLPELSKEQLLSGSDDPPLLREDGMEGTYGAKVRLALPPGIKGRYVPLLSGAEAGPMDAGHSDEIYQHTGVFAPNVDDRSAFAIRVSGNSMEPVMDDGDLVICSPKTEIASGDAAVVRTHSDQVFIKFWRKAGNRILLESANRDYKTIELPVSEVAGAWPVVGRLQSGKIKSKGGDRL